MFIELHAIQNFAPSNLNRDDTGSPKDCLFGGYRRARVSSQCSKRSMREMFKEGESFTKEQKVSLAIRTRWIAEEIAQAAGQLAKDAGDESKSSEQLLRATKIILNAAELEVKEDNKTEFMFFIGKKELEAIARLCLDRWEALIETDAAYEEVRRLEGEISALEEAAKTGSKESKQQARAKSRELKEKRDEAKKAAKKAIPDDIKEQVKEKLNGGKAADLALFGRMIANLPEKNVDAACQVAHSISTHKSGVEFDFFSAVEELPRNSDKGAGHIDTSQFNSACFYRYANLDLGQLNTNLQDAELEQATAEAFIRAFIEAVPTGKQHSTAPQQKPAFVLAVVREAGLWSLANAFSNPVPTNRGDLVEESIVRLDKHWGELAAMYGTKGIKGQWFAALGVEQLDKLGKRVKTDDGQTMIDALVTNVRQAVNGSNPIPAQS